MATIVRVKRRIGEDAADSLLLSCKRLKSDDVEKSKDEAGHTEVKSLFKIAATVKSKDAQVTCHVQEALRRNLGNKHHQTDITQKSRDDKKAASCRDRLKVVSLRRAIDLPSLDNEKLQEPTDGGDRSGKNGKEDRDQAGGLSEVRCAHTGTTEVPGAAKSDAEMSEDATLRMFCMYDVEEKEEPTEAAAQSSTAETITCNNVPMIREKRPQNPATDKYVYDIYYTDSTTLDFSDLENICGIETFYSGSDLVSGQDDDMEACESDDDSNDEGNWRNDYPDDPEDDDDEEGFAYGNDGDSDGEDMRCHLDYGVSDMLGHRLKICDSASDDEDGDFCTFGEDDDDDDDDHPISKHHQMYSVTAPDYVTYRRRMLKELQQDYMEDDDDDR